MRSSPERGGSGSRGRFARPGSDWTGAEDRYGEGYGDGGRGRNPYRERSRGADPYGTDGPYDREPPARDRRGDGPGSSRFGAGGGGNRGPGGPGGGFQFNGGTLAVFAGVLVVGIGIGTGISSTTQGNQGNIASSQQLDMAVADPEFCKQYGASAFVQDLQVYTTMNPSTSFVTQPRLQPGCVIRRENWAVLQKEGAITAEQMRQCKQRMNTFAYIGSVKDKPEVRCVYQTDTVDNKFVTKGVADDTAGVTPEADQF